MPLHTIVSSLHRKFTLLRDRHVFKADILPYADHLQLTHDLPSRHSSLYNTLGYEHGRALSDLGDFPTTQVLRLWRPDENYPNYIAVGGGPRSNGMTRSEASEVFARFLRARDPTARVLRVSPYQPHDDLGSDPKERAELALLRIVSSLVFNLASLLPGRFDTHRDLCQERFLELEFGCPEAGIDILLALPRLESLKRTGNSDRSKKLMIIVDAMGTAFNRHTETLCQSLVKALEHVADRNGAVLMFTNDTW